MRGGVRRPAPAAALMVVAACSSGAPAAVELEARPLPEVRVEQVAGGQPVDPVPLSPGELEALRRGERVTLTATGTDLRPLLVALAEAAGVSLVVGPEVQGRVSVRLEGVPAREALDAVLRESGYAIARPLEALWGPSVFYVVPVNVDALSAAEIRAHFGVSPELARFMVRARVPDL